MSGAKENRPGLNALMQASRRGEFDAVVVWRFDRFARSIEQLVFALAEFRSLGIDFVSCQEALDTSTPMGKAMFTITIIGAMADARKGQDKGNISDVADMRNAETSKALNSQHLIDICTCVCATDPLVLTRWWIDHARCARR